MRDYVVGPGARRSPPEGAKVVYAPTLLRWSTEWSEVGGGIVTEVRQASRKGSTGTLADEGRLQALKPALTPEGTALNILVAAAHPDGEVLGGGVTIAKHTSAGIKSSSYPRWRCDQEREREKRRQELSALAVAAHRASKILGASSLRLHDFPDNRMDSCALLDIVEVIESSISEYNPEVIYTHLGYAHHGGDLNIDHRARNSPQRDRWMCPLLCP